MVHAAPSGCLLSSRVGCESVGGEPTKNGKVIEVTAVIVGRERQQCPHVSLERKVGGIRNGDARAGLNAPLNQRRVNAVLEVIGVGEVIEPILDVGFGERRRCEQSHHN